MVEERRRALLDLFHVHGYQLVSPPLIEFVESLVTDHELDLRTFKLTDQLSGRQMGVRADIAPQVARIDAHMLNRDGVVRLCYAGSVLHTLPVSLLGSREQLQLGAEIYGYAGVEADVEVIGVLLDALSLLEVGAIQLDIGHIGIFRALIAHFGVSDSVEQQLFAALQGKDEASTQSVLEQLPGATADCFRLLTTLHGGVDVIEQARKGLPPLDGVLAALDQLAALGKLLQQKDVELYFDLVELRGAHYHSGLVFAAYAPGWPNSIARGGRYDNLGVRFGRGRPATGFSLDLRELLKGAHAPVAANAILAPWKTGDLQLAASVSALRAQGEVVIVGFPAEGRQGDPACDRELVQSDGCWIIQPL